MSDASFATSVPAIPYKSHALFVIYWKKLEEFSESANHHQEPCFIFHISHMEKTEAGINALSESSNHQQKPRFISQC